VPRQAGAFCAIGMLHSELRQDHLEVRLAPLDGVDMAEVEAGFAGLDRRAAEALRSCGMAGIERRLDRELDLRYRGQIWSIRTALPGAAPIAPEAVRQAFEAEHRRLYGHVQPAGAIEITALRVVGRGLFAPPPVAGPPPAEAPPEPVERRAAHLDERRGRGAVPVYAGAALRPGHRLEGPLLVEEQTTTIFVGPEDTLEVDAAGDYLIHLPKGSGDDRA
jgi:N-methylhydantoinase A